MICPMALFLGVDEDCFTNTNVLKTILSQHWLVEVLEDEGALSTYDNWDISWNTEYEEWNATYDNAARTVTVVSLPRCHGLSYGQSVVLENPRITKVNIS